jgi:hypothetical protein
VPAFLLTHAHFKKWMDTFSEADFCCMFPATNLSGGYALTLPELIGNTMMRSNPVKIKE